MDGSFAKKTKDTLAAIYPKKACCRVALLGGLVFFTTRASFSSINFASENLSSSLLFQRLLREECGIDSAIIPKGKLQKIDISNFSDIDRIFLSLNAPGGVVSDEMFECEGCLSAFARGAFLSSGTVNDPGREYHLEIRSRDPLAAGRLHALLSEVISEPGVSERSGVNTVYYESNDGIVDFLNYIGAVSAGFEFMNEKIKRGIRNDANRYTNFVAANLGRSVASASVALAAIRELDEADRLDSLGEELAATAHLRLDNPDATLAELGALHEPRISKSGVNHRLQKIIALKNEILHG